MSDITYLGNNQGIIYITTPDGSMVLSNLGNTSDNVVLTLQRLYAAGPAISGSYPFFSGDVVDVTLPGNILDITIDGVAAIGAPVTAVVGDPAATALAIVNAINSYTSPAPNFAAQAFGSSYFVYYPEATTTYNGFPVTVTTDPDIVVSAEAAVHGGSDGTEAISPTWGIRVWLDATSSAVPGVITGTEITGQLMSNFIYGRPQPLMNRVSDLAGNLFIGREGVVTVARVTGAAAASQVGSIIMTDARPGDRLTIYGTGIGNSFEVVDASATVGSVPNIYTENTAPYLVDSAVDVWQAIYIDDPSLGLGWFEYSRAGQHSITISDLAAADIPQGLPTTASVTPILGGTTFTLVPRTDPQTQVLTGGPYALTGNNNFVGDAAAIAGDTFTISGGGVVVTDAGGQILVEGATVPEQMAAQGTWTATMKYNGSAWVCEGIYADMTGSEIIQDSQIFDLDGAKIQAASIPAGKYGAGSIVGADIANGTIDTPKLSATVQAAIVAISTVYSISTTIPAADILTINATPYQIIPAPAAGLGIEVVSASARVVYNTTPYATDTDLILVTDTVGFTNYQALNSLSLQVAAGDKTHRFVIFDGTTGALNQVVAAQALMATTPTTDPTAGDSDVIVNVLYRLIPC